MRNLLMAAMLLGALLLGFGPAPASAAPASSLVPSVIDTLVQNQSQVDQVHYRKSACHWHRKCGWRRVCGWRHGYYSCRWKWRCWRWCHKHYTKRRLYYYNY
ncbi:MAG: hypothetical protein R3D57_17480 [Hyphomicrobiaceae bacterium]